MATFTEYNESVAQAKKDRIVILAADLVEKISDAGDILEQLAMLSSSKHADFLYNLDSAFESICNDIRNEYVTEVHEAATVHLGAVIIEPLERQGKSKTDRNTTARDLGKDRTSERRI